MAFAQIVHGEVIVRFDSQDTGRASLFVGDRVRTTTLPLRSTRMESLDEFDIPSLSTLKISGTKLSFAVYREPWVDIHGELHWGVREQTVSYRWYERVFDRSVTL